MTYILGLITLMVMDQHLNYRKPTIDNSLAENWTSWKKEFGTPGSINSGFLSNNKESITSSRIEIFNNYPNPFNPTTSIKVLFIRKFSY